MEQSRITEKKTMTTGTTLAYPIDLLRANNTNRNKHKDNAMMDMDWDMPQTKKRRMVSATRRVQFAPIVVFLPNDRSDEEVSNAWYSKEELNSFKSERKVVVKTLKEVNFQLDKVDQSTCCLRGYEAYFSCNINKEMRLRRSNVAIAVFGEQQWQRDCGVSDPERIKQVCEQATEWACERAIQLGNDDETEIRLLKFFSDDNNYFDMNLKALSSLSASLGTSCSASSTMASAASNNCTNAVAIRLDNMHPNNVFPRLA